VENIAKGGRLATVHVLFGITTHREWEKYAIEKTNNAET
jgi:hypothetical protein